MARNFSVRTDIDNTDPINYPDGRLLDSNPAAANNGTQINESVYGDLYQLFLKILREANVTPNGNPDTDSNSQYFSAFQALFTNNETSARGLKKKVLEIGAWNMNTTASVTVAHGITGAVLNIRSCEVIIRSDLDAAVLDGQNLSNLNQGHFDWGNTNVVVRVINGTTFQTSPDYNDATINRGWILIEYF